MARILRIILIAAVLAAPPLLVGRAAAQYGFPAGDVTLTQSDVDFMIGFSKVDGEEEYIRLLAASGLAQERIPAVLLKITIARTAFAQRPEGEDWRAVARRLGADGSLGSGGAVEYSDRELDLLERNMAEIEEAFRRVEALD